MTWLPGLANDRRLTEKGGLVAWPAFFLHFFSPMTTFPFSSPERHPHGPANAEHELKKAYDSVIDVGVTHFWDRHAVPGVYPFEAVTLYKLAFDAYRNQNRLAAERWARSVKHLSRAFWHEAKIAYLQPRTAELPFLKDAYEEYSLREGFDNTTDLLNGVANHIPPGLSEMPEEMKRFLSRGRKHLDALHDPQTQHELLRTEHIKAAHEYGRVLECMALAYEAEAQSSKAA